MSHKTTEDDIKLANIMRSAGFPYTAKYIELFGYREVNPLFTRGANEQTEAFYKRCVEERHPWYFYMDPPEEGDLY